MQNNVVTNTETASAKATMVKVSFRRESGSLMMYVDARGLHETLDALGAVHENGQYINGPSTANSVLRTSVNKLSTAALLHREYPRAFNLSTIYSSPPTTAALRELGESAYEVSRRILEHYHPIDISVEIQKKVIR